MSKDTVALIIQYLVAYKQAGFTHTINKKDFDSYLSNGQHYISEWKIKKFADKLKDIVCLLIGCTKKELEDRDFKEKELGEQWWGYFNTWEGNYPCNLQNYSTTNNTTGKYSTLYKLTPRLLLQLIGTDCGRNIIHPNIWVNSSFADYKLQYIVKNYTPLGGGSGPIKFPNWIFTDVRFPNEVKAIKDRGGIVIRVNRDSWKPRAGDTIKIKVFSNWSVVTYTHTDDEGNHCGVGTDGFKYKSSLIKEYKEEHPSETALDNVEFDYTIDNNGTVEELIEKVKIILTKEQII